MGIQSVMVGGSWRQEQEVVGHVGSSQEAENSTCEGSASFLLFIRCRTPAWEMVLPTVKVGLPTSVKLI